MTPRQKEYFKEVVELYIEQGQPISSSLLIEKKNIKISSATIRNEMNNLEKEGYLQKAHISSGRVPTVAGYKYYAENIAKSNQNEEMEKRLKDIFSKRRVSIDMTLDQAAAAISDIAGLTLVTSSTENKELMRSIQLTPIDDKRATIVIVTSTGRVQSKLLDYGNYIEVEDIRIAVRLFKERLVDTPLKEIGDKIESLMPMLEKLLKNYEEVIQAFIQQVFDFHTKKVNKVFGNSNIIKAEEIKREDLVQLIELIENKSIWNSIEGKIDEDESIKIDIRSNNTSIISKKIELKDLTSREISIVGSNRIDYGGAKTIFKILEKLLNNN